jgi:hypothetical protein
MRLNERMKYEAAMNSVRVPQRPESAGALASSIGGWPSYRNDRLRGASNPSMSASAGPAASYGTAAAVAGNFDDAFARLKRNREAEYKSAADEQFHADLERAAELRRAVESSGVTWLAPPPAAAPGGGLGASTSRGSGASFSASSSAPAASLFQDAKPYHLIAEWERHSRNLEAQLAQSHARLAQMESGVHARALGMAESEVHAKDHSILALHKQLLEQTAEVRACVRAHAFVRVCGTSAPPAQRGIDDNS